MIEWKFILNPGTDALEIDEPVRWSDFENSLERDDKIHGMRFEASISTLQFFGVAAEFLRDIKEEQGLKANVIFQALLKCNEEEDFEEVLKGRLNFGRYKEDCGDTCFVTMPIEEDTCAVIFKNRYDQKVDIDNSKAFDTITNLNNYAGLNFPIDLPAKELFVGAQGDVVLGGYDFLFSTLLPVNNYVYMIRPNYKRKRNESLNTTTLDAEGSEVQGGPSGFPFMMTPVFLYDEIDAQCFTGDFNLDIRLKGSYDIYTPNRAITAIRLVIFESPDPQGNVQNFFLDVHLSHGPALGVAVGSFDEAIAINTPLTPGWGLYAGFIYATIGINSQQGQGYLRWDEETRVDITANKKCPDTVGDAYLIHETLSRATEAITNNCMRVKSSLYGRTDSQPFSFPSDGCGSLRMLTSGLKLRAAPEDKFFTSVKELIEGLTAIDNIGFAVEEDTTIPGKYILRVEAVEYFYQPFEMLRFDGIAKASRDIEEARHYAKIEVGYNNWKVERVNGLDEFNSEREYRTSLDSVATLLNIRSNLVTGSYPYEITRQQSFAVTGGADTKYDNETFLICLVRDAYAYQVEQGGITAPQNIYSPGTVINFRLSPLRNLMRWFGSIISSYANYTDTANKLFFSSGTGNLAMEGEQTSIFCKLENHTIKENQHLSTSDFVSDDYLPIWKNELISFDYPLSTGEYKTIKSNPYGYISFQCGQGPFEKGFIKELKYKPASGMASFVLRKKYF